MIIAISELLDELEYSYDSQCVSSSDDTSNLVFDIGYPLYSEESIVNNEYDSVIYVAVDLNHLPIHQQYIQI